MKRIICFVFALGLALSLVVPAAPASADYQSQSNFWQWVASTGGIPQKVLGFVTGDAVCPDSEDGKHHASSAVVDTGTGHFVCTCAYCGETYNATYTDISNAYTDTLDDSGILSVNSSGSLIWYPTFNDLSYILEGQQLMVGMNGKNFYVPNDSSGCVTTVSEDLRRVYFSYNGQKGKPDVALKNTPSFVCPVNGTYTAVSSLKITVNTDSGSYEFVPTSESSYVCSAGDTINLHSNGAYCRDDYVSQYTGTIDFPTYEISDITSAVDEFYTPATRSTVMTGDYSVVGDNNEVFHHEETIFNEDNSTFYNPVTDTSSTITNWNYDYSTRTYTMTDDNGQEKSLTYGDDNIVINDGGNTFFLFYGDVSQSGSGESGSGESGSGESGSGESGSGESGTGLIAQVGRLLGTLVSGLLGGITAFLSAILSALTNLVDVIGEGFNAILDTVLQWLAQLPLLFESFLEFLDGVFAYLPYDIVRMLSFGVACVVFVGILKALRR